MEEYHRDSKKKAVIHLREIKRDFMENVEIKTDIEKLNKFGLTEMESDGRWCFPYYFCCAISYYRNHKRKWIFMVIL